MESAQSAPQESALPTLIKTWLFVALSDATFASVSGYFIPPSSTPARVFRGVASVLLGKDAMTGGAKTAIIGLGMHFWVALFWSTVFVVAVRNFPALRQAIQTSSGALLVASVYGVSIWLVMTLIVIPAFVHHGPTLTPKYWVQLVGHIPFVVGPMVYVNRRS